MGLLMEFHLSCVKFTWFMSTFATNSHDSGHCMLYHPFPTHGHNVGQNPTAWYINYVTKPSVLSVANLNSISAQL